MFDPEMAKKAGENLRLLRERKRLVHNITNYVSMNYIANALLACGASPVMAHAIGEVEEMVALAGALVLNIGTLTPDWVEAMVKAGKQANRLNVPVVLDPVGAGATRLRTESAKQLMAEVRVSVVRGNASEILALARAKSSTLGVDAIHSVDEAADVAVALARDSDTTIAVTGETDFVTDGGRAYLVYNGHPLMGRVTGTGCVASAIVAAFLAVDPDAVNGAATALAFFGLAGEEAAANSAGPGSFQTALLDSLYNMNEEALRRGTKIKT
jgi:hydroxyethylthiazole kinase